MFGNGKVKAEVTYNVGSSAPQRATVEVESVALAHVEQAVSAQTGIDKSHFRNVRVKVVD